MKTEYHLILNQFLQNYKNTFSDSLINLLMPQLLIYGMINSEEESLIKSQKTPLGQFMEIVKCLDRKEDNTYDQLENVFQNLNWTDFLGFLKSNKNDTIDSLYRKSSSHSESSTDSEEYFFPSADIERLRKILKRHYKSDLQHINMYWNKFKNINGSFPLSTFYNKNLNIIDSHNRLNNTEPLTNFRDIFNFTNDCKRILIYSDPGYGKSTFVHQIAQEWVDDVEQWVSNFWFVLLFRLGELDENHLSSLQHMLERCLPYNDAVQLRKMLDDSNILEKTLFIFDAYDELMWAPGQEIRRLIFGNGPQLPLIIVTTRTSHFDELKQGNVVYIQLKGFTDIGVRKQLALHGVELHESEHEFLKGFLPNPLFLTLYCICPRKLSNNCCMWEPLKNYIEKLDHRFSEGLSSVNSDVVKSLTFLISQHAVKQRGLKINQHFVLDDLTSKQLQVAKAVGYIVERDEDNNSVTFPHYMFVDYFAALYFARNTYILKEVISPNKNVQENQKLVFTSTDCNETICVEEQMIVQSMFSHFLCHFNEVYRQNIWEKFDNRIIPWINNVDTINVRPFDLSSKNKF